MLYADKVGGKCGDGLASGLGRGVERSVDAGGFKAGGGDADVEPELVEDRGGAAAQATAKVVTEIEKYRLQCVAIRVTYQRTNLDIDISIS